MSFQRIGLPALVAILALGTAPVAATPSPPRSRASPNRVSAAASAFRH